MPRASTRIVLALVIGMGATVARAQDHAALRPHAFASHILVPQARHFGVDTRNAVRVSDVSVGVVILEQVATTTMDIHVRNESQQRQEAEMLVPVPDGAVLKGFTFQGGGSEPTAQILFRDEARKTYDAIVAKVKDPALLEFAGSNLVRSSVFPVEAGGTQAIRLTYEHVLNADGNRVDYALPRTESIEYTVPWKIAVKIMSKRPIATLYSPSHQIETTRTDGNTVSARIAQDAQTEPGSFRLSYLFGGEGVAASLFAYPDPKTDGGYFLLVAGLPAQPAAPAGATQLKRELTMVIDRSGSMNGEKIEQVREAALQVVAGLEAGEAFNIIIYNESVECFSPNPVVKTRETEEAARTYIRNMTARGGTNIHDALLEALRPKPAAGFLPIVLFLTDGLPTVGQTSEVAIRELAAKANPHNRRVFTFGVGVDINTPLLGKIAQQTRATTTFVLPRENVEVKVGQVFKRLAGPVLADAQLALKDTAGNATLGRLQDIVPARLPDLFDGDQLVLLGRYSGSQPLNFHLSGNYMGRERTFQFAFDVGNATTRHAFVPRLWASRKIALLTGAIRDLGADNDQIGRKQVSSQDPRVKELVDEIVKLSKEHGVLSEYTSFLALEGTDLTQPDKVRAVAGGNFGNRAMHDRSGLKSVNQEYNNDNQLRQSCMNSHNRFLDEGMNPVSISSVQQISDRTFYRRDGRWVDGRLLEKADPAAQRKVIEVGSEEFRKLVQRLSGEGRQGCISLRGEILLDVDGEQVLVK